MPLKGLAGKTAVVTGAAGGIGAAIVRRLLAEGCRVVAADLDAGALGAALADCDPAACHVIAADISTPAGTAAYVAAALERFGSLDLLASNAGIMREGLLEDMAPDDFDRVMAVNLRGVFLGLQAALRQMKAQQRGGAIVTTASIGAFGSAMGYGAYNASKAAILSLTRTAAHEGGAAGIRANAICPGPIDTAMLGALPPGGHASFGARTAIGRLGNPAEVADLVAYLLSEEASFQTGGTYLVDGGMMVRGPGAQ